MIFINESSAKLGGNVEPGLSEKRNRCSRVRLSPLPGAYLCSPNLPRWTLIQFYPRPRSVLSLFFFFFIIIISLCPTELQPS